MRKSRYIRPPKVAAFGLKPVLAVAFLLAGCAEMGIQPPESPPPSARSIPPTPLAPQPRPGVAVSAESVELEERYRRTQADLVARGLLRTDGGGPDAPFDAADLSANFIRVAMFDEYVPASGRLVVRERPAPLRRWQTPVRVAIRFGRSVPEPARAADRELLSTLVERLGRSTGHDIALSDSASANFTVYVVNEDERRLLAPYLEQTVPGLTGPVIPALTNLSPSEFCAVIGIYDDDDPFVYRRALAFIRAEHPPLLRQACFHEEMAQGLGLLNDSPVARPSVFNDDEEFALLTAQDDLMLRILYDRRLQPGMTSAQAVPIVDGIAREVLPARSPATQPGAAAPTES